MDSDEIVSRTKFPESWLWTDIKLPPCPQTNPNWWVNRNIHADKKYTDNLAFTCQGFNIFIFFSDTMSVQKNIPLQDSITTWQFTGISLSRNHGENSVVIVFVVYLVVPLNQESTLPWIVCPHVHIFFGLSLTLLPFFLLPCFMSCLFLFSLRHLCSWTIRGNCPEGILHWPEAALLCRPRRAAGSESNPLQLQPWSCNCKSEWFK